MATVSCRIALADLCISAALLLAATRVQAQTTVLRIDPHQTDAAIRMVRGPHIALYDHQATQATPPRLLLFLAGTRARTESSLGLDTAFSHWGFHAISLDYENNVVAVSCAHSADISCFDRYRQTIIRGAAGSEKIQVDAANSILNRFEKLLVYLVKHDPTGGWDDFVANGKPIWSRIVVAGHSQGSGHAAYLGKMFAVDRVLMFSGPQDYLDDLHEPAPWQSRPSATPASRIFAFLNLKDEFNEQHQIANCSVLMNLSSEQAKQETAMVAPGETIQGSPRILVNDIATKDHHNSTLLPEFENVWKYMATADVH